MYSFCLTKQGKQEKIQTSLKHSVFNLTHIKPLCQLAMNCPNTFSSFTSLLHQKSIVCGPVPVHSALRILFLHL